MSTLQITGLEQSFHARTDSTITLQWLSQLPRTWTTIVVNRVSYIQEIIKRDSWNHVPTNDKPADLASRGHSVEDTVNSRLWCSGHEWISHPKSYWLQLDVHSSSVLPENRELKQNSKTKNRTSTPVENRTLTSSQRSSQRLNSSTQVLPTEKFSSCNKLINVVSNVIRFINALRIRIDCHTPQLAETEIRRIAIAKTIRQDPIPTLPDEYAILRRQAELPRKSPLLNLSPFHDKKHDVIRVGGRLAQSSLHEDKKFPYLIAKDSPLKELLICHYHEVTLLGGGILTLNTMREQFWLVNGRKTVNNFIKNCVKCFGFQSKFTPQLMVDLPSERVTPARAFSTCGIDFAGPFNDKDKKNPKIYIAVFICVVTKAIHLELVSSLTKEDCILALKRFTSRRGAPKKIITDNGSNFSGARNVFLRIQSLLNKGKQHLTGQGTEWVTIPPRAPHFGGLMGSRCKEYEETFETHTRTSNFEI